MDNLLNAPKKKSNEDLARIFDFVRMLHGRVYFACEVMMMDSCIEYTKYRTVNRGSILTSHSPSRLLC